MLRVEPNADANACETREEDGEDPGRVLLGLPGTRSVSSLKLGESLWRSI